MGYQSENQFMQMLQNRIQTAQSQSNINSILDECESLNKWFKEWNRCLTKKLVSSTRQDGTNGDHGSEVIICASGEGGNTGKGGNG